MNKWPFLPVSLHLVMLVSPQSVSEPEVPAVLPPSLQGIEELSEAVAGLSTMEEVMQYLEPERWQVDMEELYKPTWHVLGKSFILNKKPRGRTFSTCTLQFDCIEVSRFKRKWLWSFCLLCFYLRRNWSQSLEGGGSAVQLHSTQLFGLLAWGAEKDGCHFLAQLPPGEALWWKLCLLLPPLLRLSVCSHQGHQEIPRGKYLLDHEIQWTCNLTFTFSFWNSVKVRFALKQARTATVCKGYIIPKNTIITQSLQKNALMRSHNAMHNQPKFAYLCGGRIFSIRRTFAV